MTTDPVQPGFATAVDTTSVNWGKLRWYRVLGYYFSLVTSDDRVDDYMETVIGRFSVEPDPAEQHSPPTPGQPAQYMLLGGKAAPDGRSRLYYNDIVISSSMAVGDVLDHVFWHINAEAARRTGEFVLIHSGAVGTPSGEGLLIPGTSGTGKSTLVAGLLHAGFSYYSDEAAAIDPIERLLYGYPKAITLKDRTVFETYPDLPSAQTNAEFVRNHWYVVPSQIRPGIIGSPTSVGFVVVSRFEAGATTTVEPISRAEAALALGRSVMNIGRYRSRVLPLLAHLVAGSQCLSLHSGDLEAAVEALVTATAE